MFTLLSLIPTVLAAGSAGGTNSGGTTSGSDTSVNITTGGSAEPVQDFSLGGIISFLVSAALVIAGLVFFFMLVIGGLRWIMSGGDKAQTEGARNQITAALIGLVIVFSAWAIATLLGNVFGINFLEFELPKIADLSA